MFGGLDIKGASSKDEDDKLDDAPAPATSAFSFLSGTTPAAAPPSAPSAFSFLGGDGRDASESKDSADDKATAPAGDGVTGAASAFSFMTAPVSPKSAEPASGFSFLTSSPGKDQAVLDEENNDEEELVEAEPPSTAFSFLAAPSPTASASPSEPPPDIMSTIPTSESLPPAGSGIVFGGAAAAKKKPIKKRTRGVKVGQGRSEALPPPPPRPISPVAATLDHQELGVKEPEPEEAQDDSAKDGALEAVRRAEEFMQKMQHEEDKAETFQPPSLEKKQSVDETYEAARAMAEEAEAQLSRQKRPFGLGGWFPRKSGSHSTGDRDISSGSGRNLSSSSLHDGQAESAAERIRREQEDIKRAMAERHLAMQQQQQQSGATTDDTEGPPESQHSGDDILPVDQLQSSSSSSPSVWRAPTSSWSRPKAEASPPAPPPPPPRKRTPQEKLQELLQKFEHNVKDAMNRVSQLRQQRNMLLEERFVSLAKERLAIQQMAQAEAQQMSAAEAEDFDLADRLAAVIDGHARDLAELQAILESIGRALEQLESQKQDVVGGVASCFETVKEQLELFQEEQETTERKDDTEAMRRFSTTARQLSSENERLQNDFKILERDEELMTEERKELELAIHEQTEDLERSRDEASEKLKTVENEIEDLRKLLQEKEAQASSLRSEMETYESGISKVRVKFSRQVTRVEKKETSLRENRLEWENEKAAYESLKTAHEAEVKEHSEALLAHDELMSTLKKEITLAGTFREIVAKEVVFESSNFKDAETDGDFAQLQADVVKCEAAVSEGKQLLKATVAVLDNLEKEHRMLMERIPHLEEEKKTAVGRRDFKAAGKASKEIKDATARLHDCIEELTGDAAERKKSAEADLEKLEEELEAKRAIAHEKEKEVGLVAMEKLAEKIGRLVDTKREICGKASPGSVQGVGALVLRAQLDALKREGQTYGARFGGWDDLMKDIEDDDDELGPSDDQAECISNDNLSKREAQLESKQGEQDERSPDEVDPARVEKFRQLNDRLKKAEESLEAAVEREDYDEAEKVNEIFEQIKSETEELNLTDAELDIVMREDDDAEPVSEVEGEVNISAKEENDVELGESESDENESLAEEPPEDEDTSAVQSELAETNGTVETKDSREIEDEPGHVDTDLSEANGVVETKDSQGADDNEELGDEQVDGASDEEDDTVTTEEGIDGEAHGSPDEEEAEEIDPSEDDTTNVDPEPKNVEKESTEAEAESEENGEESGLEEI